MHLLFDLDGTLTDPFVGITTCIRYAVEGLGRTAPAAESLRWCIGPPLKGSFARLLDTRDEQLLNAAVAKYRERFSSVGLFENELYPGIADTLGQLKKDGHCLTVATSKPTVYSVRIVEHFGLNPYFRSVDGSELNGTRGDKTDLIAHILQRDGLAAEDAIMIGDRGQDMAGARANGVKALGVLWGYGSREELMAGGAFGCVLEPKEMPGVIEERVKILKAAVR